MTQAPPPKRHPYDQWSPDARALDLVGDKWTLLIVRDLASGPRRFVELQRVLPGISTEQLRSRLNRMVADGMLTRKRFREVPPRVDYELTERARELLPTLGQLARWGYEWAWSEPRAGESVDVGAIFRLAPGVIDRSELAGTIALGVRLQEDKTASYAVTLGVDGTTLKEGEVESPDASIDGAEADWVRALSPGCDRSGLSVEGDSRLAEALLDALSPAPEHAPAVQRDDRAA
jgi:DNA-binding HxlR family transcriptional regulator